MTRLGCIGQSPEERIDAGWWGPAFFLRVCEIQVDVLSTHLVE